MSQQSKAGVFLLSLLALFLVAYLTFSTKNETIKYDQEKPGVPAVPEINNLEKISQAEMAGNYRASLKSKLDEFEIQIGASPVASTSNEQIGTSSEADLNELVAQIADFKVGIMGLTVPEEMKNFHFNLVKILSDEKDLILEKRKFVKEDLLGAIAAARSQYDWLRQP